MLTLNDARTIGNQWIENWNDSQLTNYCSLYDDNAEEFSSLANRLVKVSHGHLKGKDVLYSYWQLVKAIFPENKYVLKRVNLYGQDVVVYFTMTGLNSDAIARISLNDNFKISKITISHV